MTTRDDLVTLITAALDEPITITAKNSYLARRERIFRGIDAILNVYGVVELPTSDEGCEWFPDGESGEAIWIEDGCIESRYVSYGMPERARAIAAALLAAARKAEETR